jgi:hypothetical protein
VRAAGKLFLARDHTTTIASCQEAKTEKAAKRKKKEAQMFRASFFLSWGFFLPLFEPKD